LLLAGFLSFSSFFSSNGFYPHHTLQLNRGDSQTTLSVAGPPSTPASVRATSPPQTPLGQSTSIDRNDATPTNNAPRWESLGDFLRVNWTDHGSTLVPRAHLTTAGELLAAVAARRDPSAVHTHYLRGRRRIQQALQQGATSSGGGSSDSAGGDWFVLPPTAAVQHFHEVEILPRPRHEISVAWFTPRSLGACFYFIF
jgi:hypothetical protein